MLVLSRGFSPSFILINPIACSYTLSDSFVLFLSSSLVLYFPFSSLNFIILSIVFEVKPEIWDKIALDAVFIFTPTLFTTLSTTKSKASVNSFCFTSCWYNPTPIDLGSIFTSSDKGSCSLLPIEIALLSETFNLGNSFIAKSDAE